MSATDEDVYALFEALESALGEKFKELGSSAEKSHGLSDLLRNAHDVSKLQDKIKAQEELIKKLANRSPSQVEKRGGVTTATATTPQKTLHSKNDMMRAEQIKILGDLYDEKFSIAEKMRMEKLVEEHREIHPLNTEVCPVCLEDVPITSLYSVQYFGCCGNFMCYQCLENSVAGGQIRMKNCPCCREEVLIELETVVRQVEKQAKRGRAYAQTQLGIYYLDGSTCDHGEAVHHQVDIKEALKWFNLAAEQKQPDAIRIIAQLHGGVHGDVKEVEQCQIKARALMKEAADLGNIRAQRNYGMMCRLGQGGPEDKAEAARYYTLAYAQKGDSPLHSSDDSLEEILHAGFFLGIYHYYGDGGLTRNLHIAKYYLEEHVKENEKHCVGLTPRAYMLSAACLMQLNIALFLFRGGCDCFVPGYSPVPRVMSLYRKSVKLGIDDEDEASRHSKGVLGQMLIQGKSKCENCGVAAKDTPEGTLKECSRCHSAWYCGKECQTEHWKAGHKSDCVRQQV